MPLMSIFCLKLQQVRCFMEKCAFFSLLVSAEVAFCPRGDCGVYLFGHGCVEHEETTMLSVDNKILLSLSKLARVLFFLYYLLANRKRMNGGTKKPLMRPDPTHPIMELPISDLKPTLI